MSEFAGLQVVTDERVREGIVAFVCMAMDLDLDDVEDSEVNEDGRATVSMKFRPKLELIDVTVVVS